MSDRAGAVTMKGNPMTLEGPELKEGAQAPDFTLKAPDMSDKTLGDFAGKPFVLVTVPSLDTPVCDTEVRRFNQEAAGLGDMPVVVVSMDLPMAQKRWCGAAGADHVHPLSDYLTHDFGTAYGLRVKEIGLLARSVSVIDADGKVAHHQLVKEIAEEPDYDAALAAAKKVAG